MIVSVHQPQYIPWLGYFDKIARSDAFVFLDCVQYKEREFQNRNKIRTKDGWIWLTVPVVTKGLGRQGIADVRIDNSLDWPKAHKESLRSWYGRAPYFKKHFPFFEELYARRWERLIDLNVHIIMHLLKQFAISTPVRFESDLGTKSKKTDRIVEICDKLKAGVYLSGAGGKCYLDEKKFEPCGIGVICQEYRHPAYRQQFMKGENDFMPGMSAIDLLFNEGPASREIFKTEKKYQ